MRFDNQLRDKGLPRWGIEGGDAAQQKGEHVYVPQLHEAGDRKRAQAESEETHRRLRGEQQSTPIEMIGGKPGERQEQKLRTKLQPRHHADSYGTIVSELSENDPILRRALHPCPDIGDERSA